MLHHFSTNIRLGKQQNQNIQTQSDGKKISPQSLHFRSFDMVMILIDYVKCLADRIITHRNLYIIVRYH